MKIKGFMFRAKNSQVPPVEGEGLAKESYGGVDDPRLPEDVRALPVGKREDWVDEFNWCYWCYYKENDPDYNENETSIVNAVRYASKKAWDRVNKPKDDDMMMPMESRQGLSGKRHATRQRLIEQTGSIDADRKWEARDKGFRTDITIIQAGWSLNGHYYSQEVVAQIAELASRQVVGYACHGDTFDRDPIQEWVMVIEQAWKDDAKAKGSIYIFSEPNGAALKERIEKYPQLFGVSIDAYVKAEEGEVNGKEGLIIKEVVALNSVDIVMMPAAGGAFDGNIEEGAKGPHALVEKVVPYNATPKADMDMSWDAGEARKRIKKWASDADGNIDFAKYRRAFAWYDADKADTTGAYKLPHHDIVDGELKVVLAGVRSACGVMMGAMGGMDMPEKEMDATKSHLAKHRHQFGEMAPWEDKQSQTGALNTMDVKELKENHPAVAELLIREGADQAKEQYEAKIAEMDAENQRLVAENAAQKAKLDEAEQAAKKQTFEQTVNEKVGLLPERLRSDEFRQVLLDLGPDRLETIDRLVQERAKAMPVVEGQGAPLPSPRKEEPKSTNEDELLAKFKKAK